MAATSQDDPEVQKNGFREIVRSVDVNPAALEGEEGGDSFFENWFDPTATFQENLETFNEWVSTMDDLFSGVEDELEDRVDDVSE